MHVGKLKELPARRFETITSLAALHVGFIYVGISAFRVRAGADRAWAPPQQARQSTMRIGTLPRLFFMPIPPKMRADEHRNTFSLALRRPDTGVDREADGRAERHITR